MGGFKNKDKRYKKQETRFISGLLAEPAEPGKEKIQHALFLVIYIIEFLYQYLY